MALSADLRALGAAVQPPEQEWGDPDLPRVELCPRLKSVYSPRASWVEWRGFGEAPHKPEWARVWDYGPTAEALGLSLARNSKRPPRYGLKGMPGTGRKQVWRALALLEEDRACLSFWTVSLPSAALTDLARLDSWACFQDRLRKELGRLLQAKGLRPRLVGVAELQPKRSRVEARPCPHLHVVFQGRRSRRHHWVLSPADLDGVIRAALASAGVRVPDGIDGEAYLRSAGNVQQVKKSVRAYLSKYMTKGSGDTCRWVGTEAETLLPRQWWFWSRPLRDHVLAHIFPINFGFLAWVHRHRREIENAGLARFRVLPLDREGAPITYEVSWLKCCFVAELLCLWVEDDWCEEEDGRYRLYKHFSSQCQP